MSTDNNANAMSMDELIAENIKLHEELDHYRAIGTPERLSSDAIELRERKEMDDYDYRSEVYNDVINWLKNENTHLFPQDYDDAANFADAINEELWADDSVTGNGSGSYWFNAWKAASALAHNYDLLDEAMEDFGSDKDIDCFDTYEAHDVTIRCYLLHGAIDDALDNMYDEEQYNHPEMKRCFTHYCEEHLDFRNLREFAELYLGSHESVEEAADSLDMTQEALMREYEVYHYPDGVYILKRLPKLIEL